jgi:hypothetical protein
VIRATAPSAAERSLAGRPRRRDPVPELEVLAAVLAEDDAVVRRARAASGTARAQVATGPLNWQNAAPFAPEVES